MSPQVLEAYLHSEPGHQAGRLGLNDTVPGVLTTTDRALAAAYTRHHATALPTGELVRALTEAGLARTGTHALIASSPLLRQAGHGVQELRHDDRGAAGINTVI